jgi:hypothetical protein
VSKEGGDLLGGPSESSDRTVMQSVTDRVYLSASIVDTKCLACVAAVQKWTAPLVTLEKVIKATDDEKAEMPERQKAEV